MKLKLRLITTLLVVGMVLPMPGLFASELAERESKESSAAAQTESQDEWMRYTMIAGMSDTLKLERLVRLQDDLQSNPIKDAELSRLIAEDIALVTNKLKERDKRELRNINEARDLREQIQQQAERQSKRASSEKLEKLKAERDAAPLTPIDTSKLRSKETPRVNSHDANNKTWMKIIFGGAFVAVVAALVGYMWWSKQVVSK